MTPSLYRKLIACSYNIVGSHEDARDLAQDAMEKFLSVDKSQIRNEAGYLMKTVVNLSINFKKRQDRTSGYGVWLPEPVSTADSPDVALNRKWVARYSLMILLEQLNPKERAVYILKEGFAYSHDEIADLLDIAAENSRQLLTRARKKIGAVEFSEAAPISAPEQILSPYLSAIAEADTSALEKLLVDDVQLMADGGRDAKVVRDFVSGREETARLLQFVFSQFLSGKKVRFSVVNHQPAIGFFDNDRLYNCQVFSLSESGKIVGIHSVVDAGKLKNLTF